MSVLSSQFTPAYQHITVVGTGLIGGSVVMAIRQMAPQCHIHAVDTHGDSLRALLKNNVVDTATQTLPAEWPDHHLVILATHLESNIDYLQRISPQVLENPTITITDIGSCKTGICQVGEELLPNGQFIGGHPLAGKEVSGLPHATGLLFAGKPYVLCPTTDWQQDARKQTRVEELKAFLEHCLQVRIGFQTPGHHDWAMAYVSHLPQLYAVLLTNLLANNGPEELLGFHGAGMDGQLRLAASPYAMWQPIFANNATHIREAIRGCRDLLDEAEKALEPPTTATMEQWFRQANQVHRDFHKTRNQTGVYPNAD